jgi:DNA-binding response OmpR family regulator
MSQPKAFIIEDDEDLAMIFTHALTSADFEVEVISNGKDAIERLDKFVPDIIILDMHLPHVSGVDVLAHMKKDKTRFEKTRVIVTTADARLAEEVDDQADLALVKPVTFKQIQVLAARLRQPREEPPNP